MQSTSAPSGHSSFVLTLGGAQIEVVSLGRLTPRHKTDFDSLWIQHAKGEPWIPWPDGYTSRAMVHGRPIELTITVRDGQQRPLFLARDRTSGYSFEGQSPGFAVAMLHSYLLGIHLPMYNSLDL